MGFTVGWLPRGMPELKLLVCFANSNPRGFTTLWTQFKPRTKVLSLNWYAWMSLGGTPFSIVYS